MDSRYSIAYASKSSSKKIDKFHVIRAAHGYRQVDIIMSFDDKVSAEEFLKLMQKVEIEAKNNRMSKEGK